MRVAREAVTRLTQFYKAQGYTLYKREIMGRAVGPLTADHNDQLIAQPNPPPLAQNGDTPQSRISRDESGSIGVGEKELKALEASGDFIPL